MCIRDRSSAVTLAPAMTGALPPAAGPHHPNGTTRHLHFDVQLFTRDGWIWVNPYTTLVAAYERLIGGRGREIGPETTTPPALSSAVTLAPAMTGALPPAAGPQADAAAGRHRN